MENMLFTGLFVFFWVPGFVIYKIISWRFMKRHLKEIGFWQHLFIGHRFMIIKNIDANLVIKEENKQKENSEKEP